MVRKVCLFGLSADPPTGYGGHVGIVQALAALPRNAAASKLLDSKDDNDAFDEIRVVPVYRHTYSVCAVCFKRQKFGCNSSLTNKVILYFYRWLCRTNVDGLCRLNIVSECANLLLRAFLG